MGDGMTIKCKVRGEDFDDCCAFADRAMHQIALLFLMFVGLATILVHGVRELLRLL
jgi:hypothetical protein